MMKILINTNRNKNFFSLTFSLALMKFHMRLQCLFHLKSAGIGDRNFEKKKQNKSSIGQMWLLCECLSAYVLWHSEHSNGRSSECVVKCWRNVNLRAKRRPQTSHLCFSWMIGSPSPYISINLARFLALSMSNPAIQSKKTRSINIQIHLHCQAYNSRIFEQIVWISKCRLRFSRMRNLENTKKHS